MSRIVGGYGRYMYVEDRSGRMEDGNLEAEAEAELRCPVPPTCQAVLYFGIARLPSGRSRSIHFWIRSSLYIPPTFSRGRRNIDLLLQPLGSPV